MNSPNVNSYHPDLVVEEAKNGWRIVRLNRPKSLHALDLSIVKALREVFEDLHHDDTVKAIWLDSTTPKAFCAGGDLGYLESLNDDKKRKAFIERVGEMTLKLRNCAKPVIGMINGVTAGAGVNLMLACDIVCSSEDAKFIQSFVNVGLVPDCGGMYLLKETVGLQKAKELMFTADVISAQEAEKLKMVMHVYTKEDLKIETEKIAQKMQKDVIILNEEYNTSELLSIVGNLDLLMGIRLHALIFAGVMGVPMIGISYDPKIDRFLESIGEESTGCLLSLKPDKVIEQIKLKWQEKQTEKKDEVLLQKLKKAAFSNAELALGLINKQQK